MLQLDTGIHLLTDWGLMVILKDDFFADLVFDQFQFLERRFGCAARRAGPLTVAYDSDQLHCTFTYCERSGYVQLTFVPGESETTVSLESLSNTFGGKLSRFKNGLYAYEESTLSSCMFDLAVAVEQELRAFLSGDRMATRKAITESLRLEADTLKDMMFGGIRTRASEAWDSADMKRFLTVIEKLPNDELTESEARRIRIAKKRLKEGA